MFSDEYSIGIGGSHGKFSLFVWDAFNNGRTNPSSTFGNDPLGSKEDF